MNVERPFKKRYQTVKLPGLTLLITIIAFACSDKTEQFTSEAISDYYSLQSGKYITYRLDSLVFTNFGRNTEIHKYQVKHVIDAEITDNLGRPSYRVFRYLRDSAGTTPWVPNGSYFITPLTDQLEYIDDNLRTIKLHLPLKQDFNWHGNAYYPANAYDYLSPNNSYDDALKDWDFTYNHFDASLTFRNQTYQNVWTVEQDDESYNVPITNTNLYGSRLRAVERFAKGIGMVYREYELWEYQPNTGGSGGSYKTGFGITLWMIDHN